VSEKNSHTQKNNLLRMLLHNMAFQDCGGYIYVITSIARHSKKVAGKEICLEWSETDYVPR
jgi:hypothetical protein